MRGSGGRGWDRWTQLSGMSMSGQLSQEGDKKWQKDKGMAYELASDVTCFLMRGSLGIKNLAL